MNKLIRGYMEFCMDEVFDTGYHNSFTEWSVDRIVGATILALGIILGAAVLSGLLLWFLLWLVIAHTVTFLIIIVAPSMLGYVIFRTIKAELAKDNTDVE
jgi:putative flippase GtrA